MRSSLISGMTRGELDGGWRSFTLLGMVLEHFLLMRGGASTEVGPLGMRPLLPVGVAGGRGEGGKSHTHVYWSTKCTCVPHAGTRELHMHTTESHVICMQHYKPHALPSQGIQYIRDTMHPYPHLDVQCVSTPPNAHCICIHPS